MEIQVNNGTQLQFSDEVFGREFNEALVHQVVVAYMAGQRAGTKGQKSRGTVTHTTAKPWRQKGTGRARAGMSSSPLWRGGGKTFAATTRDHSQKVNKKMYRGAMRSIFGELLRQGRVTVVEGFGVEAPKTKGFLAKLGELGVVARRTLVVADDVDQALYLSARNVPGIALCDARTVDPVSLVAAEQVVITVGALRAVEEWLA